MARRKNGSNGPMTGKVGNKVLSTWNGIEIIKNAPVRTAPFTEKQKQAQFIFKLTQEWISPIMPYLKIGFKGYTRTNQGVTAAKSYLTHNALTRAGYESSIDPSKMLVSYGDLPLSGNNAVELTPEKRLVFSWDPALSQGMSPRDQALLLAYNVEKADAVSNLGDHFRREGTASISLAHKKPGDYHVYLAFVAEDRSRQSNSVYLGEVSIEA